MKTTYLDNEIILLEGYKKDGTISHYQNRKLAEYKQIKQLLLHNVSQQRELLIAYNKHVLGKSWEIAKGIIERDIDEYLINL